MDRLIDKYNLQGEYDSNGNFRIDLPDSNEFSEYYSIFADEFEDEEHDSEEISDDETNITFTDGEIEVLCYANYEKDEYYIIIGER